MPSPKAGCIVPPNANLKMVYDRLQKIVKLETKSEQTVKCPVGSDEMSDDQVAENIMLVYNTVLHMLPQEKA